MATNSEDVKQVLRVDQDQESDLQALFDSVLKPDSKRPLQVPWSMRKLPESFFNPPSSGSKSINHSRENSVDSAFGGSSGSTGPVNQVPLQTAHHRAHSSPASLQQTYAVGQQQQTTTHHHIKQRSYDVASKTEDNTPLPPGWEQAFTPEGQVYYLNHTTRTTTWEDPRKAMAANQMSQSSEHISHQVHPPAAPAINKASSDVELGPLPDGWEQAQTAEGEIYFINHKSRSTSWFDPRIPQHLQQRGTGIQPTWQQSVASSPQRAQQLRLQQLQLERERLKQRQQEIRRQQEIMMRSSSTDANLATVIDPFLSSLTDHSRQESADSGLGMASNYSMPNTPEDYLASMDDNMDVSSDSNHMSSDVNLSDPIDSTDDLVPSLLVEEFPILEDVQSLINPATTKSDNGLIWL